MRHGPDCALPARRKRESQTIPTLASLATDSANQCNRLLAPHNVIASRPGAILQRLCLPWRHDATEMCGAYVAHGKTDSGHCARQGSKTHPLRQRRATNPGQSSILETRIYASPSCAGVVLKNTGSCIEVDSLNESISSTNSVPLADFTS